MTDARLQRLIATGVASPQDLEAAGAEAVFAAKCSGDLAWFRSGEPEVLSADDDTRTIRYVYSDETQDRYGDVIRARGWRLDNYLKNPMALWQHDMDQPIGRSTEVAVQGGDRPRLVGAVKFADEGTSAFHDTTYKLAKQGILKAVSVGFDPIEVHRPKGDEERSQLGLGKYGVDIRAAELLEISLVSIPANPSALQLSLKRLHDAGELDEREYEEAGKRLAEGCRDLAERAREIRRRTVTVPELSGATPAPPPALAAEEAPQWARRLFDEVREVRGLVADLRGSGGAQRPDADSPDARDPMAEALAACDLIAARRALQDFANRPVGSRGGEE